MGGPLAGITNLDRFVRDTLYNRISRGFMPNEQRLKTLKDSAEGRETKEKGVFGGCWCVLDGYRRKLREEKRNSEVQYRVQLLRQRYAGMKLIVGRDKLDEIQGVRHKIEALEHFLKANPEFQGRPSRLPNAMNLLAASRTSRHASTLTYQPVIFLHSQEVTFSQYLALPTAADAFMVTSLREGIRSGEVIPVKHGSSDRGRTTHLAQYQRPLPLPLAFDVLSKLFYEALTMPDEEAASRWQDLHNHVITETAETFATFLPRCLRAHTEHVSLSIDPSLVPLLDLPPLIPKYRHSTTQLVFVDLEGCLWVRNMSKSAMMMMRSGRGPMFEPPEATMRVLERMFTDRTPGSFVEECATYIVWRFWTGLPDSTVSIEDDHTITTSASDTSPATTNAATSLPSSQSHYSDRSCACRQPAEAQNHIFDSLEERHGVRIIPGQNLSLVRSSNNSRSTAVGTIWTIRRRC
ncbi:glycosyltransferase family 20-domain-containing protein [Pisolithus thermaeus]|nr:glycosyltransferase family 20-domain-containing protein [Pisolithus croceorrhizus]KAI6161092.1 glycosyltransferase family 20-domain-containing protein [Pisolithus thermaeus]